MYFYSSIVKYLSVKLCTVKLPFKKKYISDTDKTNFTTELYLYVEFLDKNVSRFIQTGLNFVFFKVGKIRQIKKGSTFELNIKVMP